MSYFLGNLVPMLYFLYQGINHAVELGLTVFIAIYPLISIIYVAQSKRVNVSIFHRGKLDDNWLSYKKSVTYSHSDNIKVMPKPEPKPEPLVLSPDMITIDQ